MARPDACKLSLCLKGVKVHHPLEATRSSMREFARAHGEPAGHTGAEGGPVLFQLPPRARVDYERLEAFLQMLPRHYLYAFEFRDRSWYADRVLGLLHRHGVTLCKARRHSLHFRSPACTRTLDLHRSSRLCAGAWAGRQLQRQLLRLYPGDVGGLRQVVGCRRKNRLHLLRQ